MITQKINVNLIPGGIKPRVNVSQYDYGSRTLEISLYNGTVPFNVPAGADVIIQGTKKDGRGFQYENLDFENNVVTCDITQQMTVFEDEVATELVIVTGTGDNKQQLATANFIINVEPAALRDDVVVSETDIPAIQTLPEAMAEVRAAVIATAADVIATNRNAENAATSERNAAGSASSAATSERNAAASETHASTSETNAATSARNALTSETNAAESERNASASATSAGANATLSESYTHGGTGTRTGEDTDNTEYFYHQTQDIVADLLRNYGVSVVGTQLVFGVEFLDSFNVAVVGTQLQITSA